MTGGFLRNRTLHGDHIGKATVDQVQRNVIGRDRTGMAGIQDDQLHPRRPTEQMLQLFACHPLRVIGLVNKV